MKNILVLKLRYIGDVLLATPVLSELRERFPQARLTMAVNGGTEQVLKRNPHLDEVLVVERRGLLGQIRFLRELRSRRFDCVIDLTDGDRAAIITVATGAPVRIGFNEEHRFRGLAYTTVARPRPGSRHRSRQDLDALLVLGFEPRDRSPVLYTSPQDDEEARRLLEGLAPVPPGREETPPVMLHPGARYWFKAWPPERFAAVARMLAERLGCRVLIGGDAHERELAETIKAMASNTPVVLAGRTSLIQYAAILKRCGVFIGNDNGPMHMAAALGVPVVGLFGPSNPQEWGPCAARTEILYRGMDCRRCFHPTCTRGVESCMNQIAVDEVFAAAERLLRRPAEDLAKNPSGGRSGSDLEPDHNHNHLNAV